MISVSKMNLAYKYDLNKYRNLTVEEHNESKRDNITIKHKNVDKISTIKIIFIAIVVFFILGSVIYSKVQLSAVYSEINSQKVELASLESENARLKAEIEAHTSLKNIEEYAESIGLEKLNKAQIWYIDIRNEDVVIIPEESANTFVRIKKFFDSVLEYLFE